MKSASPPSENFHDWRDDACGAMILFGAGLLTLSIGFCVLGLEPFRGWFYHFVWWSYILIVDGWVYRHRKESLILSHGGHFIFLCVWSVVLWMVFEALNFRLNNWHYEGLPEAAWLRRLGYATAFATVVPGILESADWVETTGFIKKGNINPLGPRNVGKIFMALGFTLLALALVWPRYFFPFIWVAFIFIVEPVNEKCGAASLLADWRRGEAKRANILLIAGFFCGILWESANHFAGARWRYDLPFLGGWKIFEMPLAGYLGFPFFALEVYSMTSLATFLWAKFPRFRPLFCLAAILVFAASGPMLDAWTAAPVQ